MTDGHKKLLEELSPEMIAAIGSVFCPDRTAIRDTIERNIIALSDEDYGKAMKVLYTSEQHFEKCMETLKLISKRTQKSPTAVAPR
jgi:hypothetical protein